jgi:lipid II:glycine glycyltransferase (peptidoglycan interpeptide bridge formation enzyme)
MQKHILQSSLWADFKTKYGTPTVTEAGVLYTRHKIPFTSYCYAYCPRVAPHSIDFRDMARSLKENFCIAIHFDVPNVIKGTSEEEAALNIFKKQCVRSPRDEFAKGNFLLDLCAGEADLLQGMHKKHRYNIRYAEKKGVSVRTSTEAEDFDIFYKLYKETADRQGYYGRSSTYIKTLWEVFHKADVAHIVIAEYKGVPLAAWLLLQQSDILYYPYGGSSHKHRNLHASCLVGWEAMKLGKELGCTTFDMWGAAENMDNKSDPYYGFTNFKAKFGGKHVVYLDSYDFVINKPLYKMFTHANDLRWKLLKVLK